MMSSGICVALRVEKPFGATVPEQVAEWRQGLTRGLPLAPNK